MHVMANQDRDLKEDPPLSEYQPVRTGWQRNDELQDEELEQRGKIGLIVVAIIILILICLYAFRRT